MIRAPLLSIYVTVLTLLSGMAFCQERPSAGTTRHIQLKDRLPAKVSLLKELLEETRGTDRSSVADPNNKWTLRAKRSAISWIVKTIDGDWLPPDPNVLCDSLVMTQNAFGPNDVAYSRWEANDHMVQVAQMKTIILINVQPLLPAEIPKRLAEEARVTLARNTITRLIRNEVDFVISEPTTRKKTKKRITSEVLSASFEHADIRAGADYVHGKCAPPEVLEEKAHHYRYWWRSINWWTDGTQVWVYMLKIEGGPWIPNYRSGLDATWFEGPPHKGKRRK